MTELVYTNKDFSGHIPSAESFSTSKSSSHAASFPAVRQLFPSSTPAAFVQQEVIQKQDSNVAQFEGEAEFLLTLILGALLMTPELMGWGGMIGAFAFAAFLRWVRATQNNKEAVKKVTPLCRRLKYDPQQLVNHLNEDSGGFSPGEVDNFINTYCNSWYYKQNDDFRDEPVFGQLGRRGLVPPKLIQNLSGSDQEKVDTIFSRLHNYGFTYIGENELTIGGFMTRKGDCHTLYNMFEEAVQAAGIVGLTIDYYGYPMLVESRPIHGRSTTSNVEGEPCWFFVNHYWGVFNGQIYDVLFMRKALSQTYHEKGEQEHRNISFKVFDNGWCMITDTEAKEKLGMDLGGKMGIVKTSNEAMVEYINSRTEL